MSTTVMHMIAIFNLWIGNVIKPKTNNSLKRNFGQRRTLNVLSNTYYL